MRLLRHWQLAVSLSMIVAAQSEAVAQDPSHATSSARSHERKIPSPRTPNSAADALEGLIRSQATAVAAGDPAAIAVASKQLSAQILALLAQFQLARGKQQDAVALYRESLDLEPSTPRRLEFASALWKSGNVSAAIAETDALVAAEPDNAVAWLVRGRALRDANRDQEAVEALTQSLKLRSDASAAFALGSTYLALHEKEKAAAIFQRILTASGHEAVWYIAVGDAYRDAGYMEDAVTNLKAGLARDPRVLHGEFFLGLTYLQMNQWGPSSESFQHLRRAVLQNPHEYISNFYLGALEFTDGSDLASAERHLRAAALADPAQPEVWLYLGMNAVRQKRPADAKECFQKSIDLTGSDESRNNYQVRRAYFGLGRLLISEGKRSEGTAMLERYKRAEQAAVAESGKSMAPAESSGTADPSLRLLAATNTPSAAPPALGADTSTSELKAQNVAEDKLRKLLASALNDLGTAEAREHDYNSALHFFEESERWEPSSLTERNLGVAAFRVKDSQEAARALQAYQAAQISAGKPMDQNAQLMLALSQFSLGNFKDAVQSFSSINAFVMRDQRSAYSYAFALARVGRAQEANQIADALYRQKLPDDLLSLVCHVYMDTENYAGSQQCFRKALEQDPGLPLAHYEIGESLIRLDRPGEAIPELRKEMQISQANPNVMTALAFALLQTSQKDEARSLLESAVKSFPDHPQSQYEFGKLLLEEGKVDSAIAHLERSEALDGSKDYVHFQLGNAYRKAGRSADSQREFQAYRQIKDEHRNRNETPH